MNLPEISWNEVSREDVGQLLSQLKKDMSGFELEFLKPEIPLVEIRVMFRKFMAEVLVHHPELVFSALYRIDIPDHITSKVMQQESPADTLADLILIREYQKVRLRKKYSS